MRQTRTLWATALAVGASLGLASPAVAQDTPDVRDIKPIVMLLVDTSGSMEKLPDCTCSTAGCEECLPQCGGTTATSERNRWSTVLEALTGEWSGFTCEREERNTSAYSGQYDYLYHLPHFRPPSDDQLANGILDAYKQRAKFGLMTFDGEPTFTDASELVTQSIFEARLSDNIGAPGMYSYGEPQPFTFPGCGDPHMIDNGARNGSSGVGELVSVGDDGSDYEVVNDKIQDVLGDVRPFGGTPIAGMLDDVRYYFDNNPDVAPIATAGGAGDPWADCRDKYVILLTDGIPSGEMREYGCGSAGYECPYDRSETIAADLCQWSTGDSACDGRVDGVFVVGFDIADAEARATLDEIANQGGTGAALFADDRATLMSKLGDALDRAAPGTTTRTVPAFASSSLGADTQMQIQLNTGFRMPPLDSEPWEGVLERRRFECNGDTLEPEPQDVSTSENDRFQEVLNNQVRSPAADEMGICPAGMPRCLLTVIPDNLNNSEGHLTGTGCFPDSTGGDTCLSPLDPTGGTAGGSGRGRPRGAGGAPAACGGSPGGGGGPGGPGGPPGGSTSGLETDLELESFAASNGDLSRQALGVSTSDERQEVIDWVYGLAGTARADARLGDIYHSSPVVVGPPEDDIADESYKLFRQRPEVANRPTVAYVGTNDGMLHAFAVRKTDITGGPHKGVTLEAGEELWAFIPPMFLKKLKSAMSSHQFMVDGTPVVRDIFTQRFADDNANGDIYRTILIVGMRGGGQGYIAMDVTDPFDPRFLWQFADEDMGFTFGKPGVGQILVEGTDGLQERGFALVPGGTGTDLYDPASGCGSAEDSDGDGDYDKPLGCPARGKGEPPVTDGTSTARENVPCYDTRGRHLFFVDVATGERVGLFDDETFNAPLTGGVSFYPGQTGRVANRAYLTDDTGVIWRIDMSNPRMSDWFADPLHDIFWDADAYDGQPAYHAPVVSTDNRGNPVILQATGNIDNLDGTASNRVVSLTEEVSFDDDGSIDEIDTALNWEIRLDEGEQVTGPLELFNGKVYFGSFKSSPDLTNACEFGQSRLWGVEYLDAEAGSDLPVGALPDPAVGDPSPSDVVRFIGPMENELVMGVQVARRPSCITLEGGVVTDPYIGTRTTQQITGQGGGQFELVGLVGGSGTKKSGSDVAELDTPDIAQPVFHTQVQSFAGSVE